MTFDGDGGGVASDEHLWEVILVMVPYQLMKETSEILKQYGGVSGSGSDRFNKILKC